MLMMHRLYRPAALPLLSALLVLSLLVPQGAWAGDNAWTPIGPYGGDLRTVAFHPSRPGVLWVGSASNGVFRSTNGGVTWTPMNQGFPANRFVSFLDVSAAEPLTLYASLHSVLYRSVDGGPWEKRSPGDVSPVAPIAADPVRADVLWGTRFENPGIYRSDDGGATWTLVHSLAGGSTGARLRNLVFSPTDPATLYASLESLSSGAPRGVLRSRDGGATWEEAASGLGLPEDSVSVGLEIAPDTGVLFASVDLFGDEAVSGVYRSADGGEHWTRVLPSGKAVTAGPGGLVLSESGQRSLDSGLTWSPLPLPGEFRNLLAAHPSLPGTVFVSPYYRGLYRSTDAAASWREASQGILAADAMDLAVDPLDPGTLYASVVGGGLFKTTAGGLAWERLLPTEADFTFVRIDELAAVPAGGETTLYAIDPDRISVLRSEDAGAGWTDLGRPPGMVNLYALAVDPRAPRSVYIGGEAYERCPGRKSTDGGETWRCLGIGKTWDLAIDPARPANIWAASRTVYRSTDRGRTWEPAGKGLPKDSTLTLAVAPSNRAIAYAGGWRGVYRTTDGGSSWAPVNGRLPPFAKVIALAVHPRNPSLVYAGVEEFAQVGGVYRSTNGGRTWKKLPVGLPSRFAGPLVIDPHDPRTLYAGTSSRGFYTITLRR